MNRTGLIIAAIALVAVVTGIVFWPQDQVAPPAPPEARPQNNLADVRPSDTGTAIEIPESPYLVIPNELVVQLKEGATVEAFTASLSGDGVKVIGWIPGFRIVQVEVSTAEREIRKAELEANPLVLSVSHQALFRKDARLNDPVFTNTNAKDDWNLKAINAEAAWDITLGSPEIIIGVVDGGVLLDHEELKGKIVKPASAFSEDGISMAGDADDLLHGTHVAITAVGAGDNGVGTSGVCPRCRVMPVEIIVGDETDYTTMLAGIEYVTINGASVINLSMAPVLKADPEAFADPDRRADTLKKLTRRFRERMENYGNILSFVETQGVVLVAGAGNDNLPGDFNNFCQDGYTICVGATFPIEDANLAVAVFSNYGFAVRVAAPGALIYSGTGEPGGKGYTSLSGTSMATPHVSGLAGLIRSANPDLKPHEVRAAILASGFADNANRGTGTRWFPDHRYAHRDMELWRRALLRLLGKDEDKLLDGPAQSLLAAMVAPSHNTVWSRPYDASGGKGDGDKALGRFIDARAALDMAASGAYRDRFVSLTMADVEKSLAVDPFVLARLHDMLWYEGHFDGAEKLGGGFTLVAEPPYDRLTVKRNVDPGEGYEEWFDYRSAYTYHHHARYDGENYSRGKVELVLNKERLVVTGQGPEYEIAYDPKK